MRRIAATLADQKITVSEDASCLAGDEVNGPFSAYCEAMAIAIGVLSVLTGLGMRDVASRAYATT